jgi:hypothetical protein
VQVETTHTQSLMPRRPERLKCSTIQLAVHEVTAEQGADEPPDDAANDASDEASALPTFFRLFEQLVRRTIVWHISLPFVFQA